MKLIPNVFTSYELSPAEMAVGLILLPEQQAVMHTRIAGYAEQKLNLKFNPKEVEEYAQEVAYLTGRIDSLQLALDESEEATQLSLAQAKQESSNQE